MPHEITRSLPWVAALCAWCGCGLLAPFDLGELPPADGDGDADLDADHGPDGDDDSSSAPDGDRDGDGPVWEPLAGCVGGATEERWLVVAAVAGETRSFLTGRDCAAPEAICTGCVATAFSPSGDRALAFVPTGLPTRIFDEIRVIDLSAPYEVLHWGFVGALATWLDDEHIAYLAEPEGWAGSCADLEPPGAPEVVDVRTRDLAADEEVVAASGLMRSWPTCCPVSSADGLRLVVAENVSGSCATDADLLSVVALGSGEVSELRWTAVQRDSVEAPIGLLPDGSGFLVQSMASRLDGTTVLHAATFDGLAVGVSSRFRAELDDQIVRRVANAFWGQCATVRRLGPACEVYCRDPSSSEWTRRRLADGDVEPVDCSVLGNDVRIMDVRQVPAREKTSRD